MSILFDDGVIVFDGGSIVFSDDAENCECCGGGDDTFCFCCETAAADTASLDVSGASNTGAAPCSPHSCDEWNGTFFSDPENVNSGPCAWYGIHPNYDLAGRDPLVCRVIDSNFPVEDWVASFFGVTIVDLGGGDCAVQATIQLTYAPGIFPQHIYKFRSDTISDPEKLNCADGVYVCDFYEEIACDGCSPGLDYTGSICDMAGTTITVTFGA